MARPFDYFVILAGMRTGSNFLEANLNEYPGLTCHGELFNPRFIGHADNRQLFGISLSDREQDPMRLIARARDKTQGLAGFRLFQDHDPRVLEACLDDPRAAKIVLTRNLLDSFVSLKIAGATGQWRLGDMKDARSARITFDAAEFAAYRAGAQAYQDGLLRRLQASGQTAFFLTYDDVSDVEVMNGLARWLGVEGARGQTSGRTKKQNPEALEDKVTNFAEMVAALSAADPFDLDRAPVFEQKRGPMVPHYVAAATSPLMFLPIRGGPVAAVEDWLTRLDGGAEPRRGFTQKSARQWLRETKGHRIFAVLRHPVPRLHDSFCRHILSDGPEAYADIRDALVAHYGLTLPAHGDRDGHRAAFLAFAGFVAGNLSGQTSIRTDPAWASQAAILQGMAQFVLPDAVLREDELDAALPALAEAVGAPPEPWRGPAEDTPMPLAAIYDGEVEAKVRQAYQRDYMLFGFRPWG